MSDNSHYVHFVALVALALLGCEGRPPPPPHAGPPVSMRVEPKGSWAHGDGVRIICECPCGETHSWTKMEPTGPFLIGMHAIPSECRSEAIGGGASSNTISVEMEFNPAIKLP